MTERFDHRLVPPSVKDLRALAFAETARRALAEPDFKKLLVERIDEADEALLPFLVRDFGMHRFVEPGMDPAVVRRMLKGAFELHKEIGYIRGVRFGLELLGLDVERWEQWFQRMPQGAPGTHDVRVSLNEDLFPEGGVSARLRLAITRMVRNTQRASQHIGIEIHTAAAPVTVHVGVAFASRIRFRMASAPRDRMRGAAPTYIGVAFASRARFRMGV